MPGIYKPFKALMMKSLTGQPAETPAGVFSVMMIDGDDYTYNADHNFLSDIPAAARVSAAGVLQNVSVAGGKLTADDITLPAVTGDPTEGVAFFFDSGDPATSRLVSYHAPVSFTPNGGDALLDFDQVNGIFEL